MKLHDLRPAPGAHKKKTRVGRGIAAGQGKTAGRGTKGQKARAGGNIPAWFEGGQTPLHQRIPKLHGFKNPFKIHYEIVNVGDISRLVELGILEAGDVPGAKKSKAAAPITVNQEILRAAGLVRTLNKPLKILGNGDLATALFVVADAVSGSARAKIEAAGGTVSILEVPTGPKAALGLVADAEAHAETVVTEPVTSEAVAAEPDITASAAGAAREVEPATAADSEAAPRPKAARRTKSAAKPAADAAAEDAPAQAAETPETEPAEDASAEPADD